jgi:putative oxidoreductase
VAALGLSVVNVVAVLSVPEMPEPAFMLHVFWGSLLAGLVLWGPGRWSVDGWLNPGASDPAGRRAALA